MTEETDNQGAITIQPADPDEAGGDVTEAGRPVAFLPDYCVEVVGSDLLTGTVVSLGDGPLPIG